MLVVGSVVVAGCSSGSGTAGDGGKGGGTAAGPGAAPTDAAVPAGVVTTVGQQAEGMVYDAVTGLLAVAVATPTASC